MKTKTVITTKIQLAKRCSILFKKRKQVEIFRYSLHFMKNFAHQRVERKQRINSQKTPKVNYSKQQVFSEFRITKE